ncbi:erythrocyte membrane protein 3, putative [Plasmodium vivax]|uniref:Erythrocyte membrane protein 3, putative n=1 Tax=Plasmodium vivax TaxID=5855 RepID=A0A1G4H2K3_PLAVI|nr:erythrocyte membrane protein 3, putative [Plasmodium vivax]VUZ97996.1 erythrocyte membrane protein 3, putative [Plasmodium vivax]
MKCHKGTKENIFLLHVKIFVIFFLIWTSICSNFTKHREFYDMPHIFGTSVASRHDRSLAENTGYTQLKGNKLKDRNGTPASVGSQPRGTPHNGLKVNTETIRPTKQALKSSSAHAGMSVKNEKNRSVGYTLKSAPHTDLNINKKAEGMPDNPLTKSPPSGLKANIKDQSATHSLKSSPPTGLQANKKDELANGTLKDTPQSKPNVSKKDKSGNNSLGNAKQSASKVNKKADVTRDNPPVGTTPPELKINKRTKRSTGHLLQDVQKPPLRKGNTIKNGSTNSTLKGDHMGGLKVNNKSIRSTVQPLTGSSPTGLKVSNDEVRSVDSPAKLAPPSKLNVSKKEKTMQNSLKRAIPSGLKVSKKGEQTTNSPEKALREKVNKKGEQTTNSPKETPTDALKAKPANHSSGKAKSPESEDNAKNDELPAQQLSELPANQKDNKTTESTPMQVSRNQLNEKKKREKPKNYPFKNAPPSGIVGSKRMNQSSDYKLKNKPPSGLVGNQKDTESKTYPLKNIPKSDLTDKQKESPNNVLKNIPAGEQKENEKNVIKESITFQKNKREYEVNLREWEGDNKKYETKVYKLKRGKHFNDNEDGVIYGINDKLTLELQEFETYNKPLYPFKRKLPELKEYNESNISKDYQLKNRPPELKKYNESNVSKDYQLQNKPHDLKAYNESNLAKENQLTHSAPTGLKEFEKPDETRDYGLKGHTDSELNEPKMKEPEIKEPKIDDQSSNEATEGNVNALPGETVTTVARVNNANKQGNNFGISGNIPSDVERIERTVQTVFCALKENDTGEVEEYIETHETKRYKLKADVKDGVKEYDEKFEKASYGFREKLPVTEVKEYDVVERIYEKPIKDKKEKIKPLEYYTYTYDESKPRPPPKNYGLLDFFPFPLHLLDRHVYLVAKEHSSLYELGKKAIKGQLTQEMIDEYLANCEKQRLKEGKVRNKHKLRIKEQKRKEKKKKKRKKEKEAYFKMKRKQAKLARKEMAKAGGKKAQEKEAEAKKPEVKKTEAKKPKVDKTEVKKTVVKKTGVNKTEAKKPKVDKAEVNKNAVKKNNEQKKKPQEGMSKTSELKKK